ncbi:MAG: ABC transporter ATP-binding protein [Christensenellaceae bacterium]|jgi:branched-chain amino acid transport system ATP-binding protein|nr:ABC transporter ATP-binding protein [Christensenellaceae bacterium]
MNERDIVLEAKKIEKRFGGLKAIDDFSLHLYKGEILGLIGPNGAGKTTMFNIIAGSFPATLGEIYVDGKLVNKPQSHQMARMGVARTYQIVRPFSNLTVLENTMVGAFLNTGNTETARRKAREILAILKLEGKADIRGKDLTLIDLKRMEVARALATEPRILLLDEVIAGLNPTGRDMVIEMISGIRETMGVSIIIIEHVMKAVMKLCDRIYVLNQGKLIAEGAPLEISSNEAVIQSYLGVKKHAEN